MISTMLKRLHEKWLILWVKAKLFTKPFRGIVLLLFQAMRIKVILLWKRLILWNDKRRLKAYDSIETCPVWNFHQVIKTNDLRYLFIKQNLKTQYEPKLQWDKIVEENSTDTSDGRYEQSQKEELVILLLRQELYMYIAAIETLSIKVSSVVIELLKKYGINVSIESMDEYLGSLKTIEAKISALKLKIELKQDEYKNKYKTDTDIKLDFTKTYIEIGKYEGFRFDPKVRTVKEYNACVKALKDKENEQR